MGLSLAEKAALFAARRREVLGEEPAPLPPPLPLVTAAPTTLPSVAKARKKRAPRSTTLPKKPATATARARSTDPVSLASLVPPGQRTHLEIRGDEERGLIARAQAGDEKAMQTLLIAHEPFVWRCTCRLFRFVADPEELLQAGRIGLMTAIRRFELERNLQLCTYAMWWIRHEVTTHIRDNEQDVSMPTGVWEAFIKARKGGATTPEEALAITGKEGVQDAFPVLQARSTRLEAPIGDADGATFGEMMADSTRRQDEQMGDAEAQARRVALLNDVLAKLPERDALVLRERYLSEDPKTLEEVGDPLGLSRERIRQIEVKALARLRYRMIKVVDDEDAESLWGGWGDQEEPVVPRHIHPNRHVKGSIAAAQKASKASPSRSTKAAEDGPVAAGAAPPRLLPPPEPLSRVTAEDVLSRRPLSPPGGRRLMKEIDP